MVCVRLARAEEVEACRHVQRRSGEIFLGTPHAYIAAHEPDDPAILRAAVASGLLWVAAGEDDRPVGQLTAARAQGGLLIAQLDVVPEHQRRGIGARLLAAAEAEAARRGLTHLWLRTFRDVPWNAPYYRRLGFRIVDAADPAAADAETLDHERALGLDPAARVTMRKPVGG